MSAWRRKAIELLPELRRVAETSEDAGMFFIEFRMAFLDAHREKPVRLDFVGRFYTYARWCWSQGDTGNGRDEAGNKMACSGDLATMILVTFWEHLFDKEEVRALLPRFVERVELLGLKEAIEYQVGEEGYRAGMAEYDKRKREMNAGVRGR